MSERPYVKETSPPDLSGRSRIARNVITSWASQFLFIITGFVLPRLISTSLGSEALGIWDLAWSVISYFGILQAGVGSSVNRYVARHYARSNELGINETISSAIFIQNVAAVLVLIFSAGAALVIPRFLSPSLGTLVSDAQFVVFVVGCGLAVQMSSNAFVGLITGLHRWDMHNGLNAGGYLLIAIGMIASLITGGGLRSLAAINLVGITVTEVVRVFLGHRVFPSLCVRPRYVKSSVISGQFVFGAKVLVPSISRLLSVQTINLLIVVFLGPVPLAIFARPMALIRLITTLIGKYAFVLTPVSSAYTAQEDSEKNLELFLTSSRAAYLISLPMIFALAIVGTELLEVWMGPDYAIVYLSTVLALGNSASMCHIPMFSLLMGQNAHGKPGLVKLLGALLSVAFAYIGLEFGSGNLVVLAACVAVPMFIADGIVIPLYALRRLNLSATQYVSQAIAGPVFLNVPFVITLLSVKILMPGSTPLVLMTAAALGFVVIFTTYWHFALGQIHKARIKSLMPTAGVWSKSKS